MPSKFGALCQDQAWPGISIAKREMFLWTYWHKLTRAYEGYQQEGGCWIKKAGSLGGGARLDMWTQRCLRRKGRKVKICHDLSTPSISWLILRESDELASICVWLNVFWFQENYLCTWTLLIKGCVQSSHLGPECLNKRLNLMFSNKWVVT